MFSLLDPEPGISLSEDYNILLVMAIYGLSMIGFFILLWRLGKRNQVDDQENV